MSLSGIFCVTFSIVFAYVADCTTEKERSYSYGLVSATFAASLVLSPALGTWICGFPNGQTQVVIISSLVTLFNLLFIMYIVPESLPESSRKTLWGSPISWRQADPFSSLRKAGNDTRLLLLSIMVFLSYLPEAGQYSCFFLYLRQVIGFSLSEVSLFISVLCITSVIAQTLILSFLMNLFGYRYTIVFGLIVQSIQLFIYGVWTSKWLMWLAGTFASLSTIIYPAISALVSKNTDSEQQGVALGILTGMRGLCNGLGPALFGLFFYLSDVHLEEVQVGGMSVPAANPHLLKTLTSFSSSNSTINQIMMGGMFKGLPFLFGVLPVLLALVVALCIDDNMPLLKKPHPSSPSGHTFSSHQNSISDI
jgi:predicted MFS family arabinose efflux permease